MTKRLHFTVVGALAIARVSIGAVGLVAPAALLATALGPSARTPAARMLARMVAMRDVAIGVATYAATRNDPRRARQLAWLGALCDATDAVAAALTPGVTRRTRQLTVTSAGMAAVAGALAAGSPTGSRRR